MKETKKSERMLNKKQLERIIIIHNAIKAGLYPNAEELQKLYLEQTGYTKVGIATIHRTIDALRVNFHAPIEFDRQRDGYYYSDKNFEFSLNSITPQEAFYLSAAKTLLSSICRPTNKKPSIGCTTITIIVATTNSGTKEP